MNIENSKDLFDSYKRILEEKGLDDEIYKWKAVQYFQENYDESADDFGRMFLNALSKHTNLIDRWQWPFIEEMAKLNSEGLHSMITHLYDEKAPLENRVSDFRETAKVLSEELRKHPEHDERKKLSQDERTLSVYLAFRYPEKYSFYKFSYYKKAAAVAGQATQPVWKRFLHFQDIASEMRETLRSSRSDILASVHSSLTEECYKGEDTLIVAQDLLYQTLDKFAKESTGARNANSESQQYWLVSPGERAALWRNAIEDGVIRIGWDEIGDLSGFETQDSVRDALNEADSKRGSRMNDSLACWEFCNVMKPGDVVIAKQGRNKLLGWGEIVGDYEYRESYETFRNCRKVEWQKTGEWDAEKIPLHLKTLTNWTSFPEEVSKIRALIWEEVTRSSKRSTANLPLNLILYGPPGTGKTYYLQNQLFPLFTESVSNQNENEFVENLIEPHARWIVVAAAILDLENARVSEILRHPLVEASFRLSQTKVPRQLIWGNLQAHAKLECETVKTSKRIEPLLFSKDEDSSWSIDAELAKELAPQTFELLDDWKSGPPIQSETRRYVFTTFHQSYSYEDFIEGIRPVMTKDSDPVSEGDISYEIRHGIFREIARKAELNPNNSYAIFIDEINRGNIAGIFGELITLIEDDKRAGEESEIYATLPYSRDRFSVPPNLHIIGTMNTADRSVEALDTALRRRFNFQRMLPNPDVIPNKTVDGVDVHKMLSTINARLEAILDKDHTIGHAFFMTCQSLRDLRSIFSKKVIPLLEEFFYNDYSKMGLVLGREFVRRKNAPVKFSSGDWGIDDLDSEYSFELADIESLTSEAFVSIYDNEA